MDFSHYSMCVCVHVYVCAKVFREDRDWTKLFSNWYIFISIILNKIKKDPWLEANVEKQASNISPNHVLPSWSRFRLY